MRGVVCTSQRLASEAGAAILSQGGNAADAAVASAAVLNVTEPASTGLGGDAFCLFYSSQKRQVFALNGSGKSARNITLTDVQKETGLSSGTIPRTSPLSVTVPGAAQLWVDCVADFGSRQLSFAQILAPAIALADKGFPVAPVSAALWKANAELLAGSVGGHQLLNSAGKPPVHGETFTNSNLARTFRALAECVDSSPDKRDTSAFYSSDIGSAIVNSLSKAGPRQGGYLSASDLTDQSSQRLDPISTVYRGCVVHESPPPTTGVTVLIALRVVEYLEQTGAIPDMSTLTHNSAEYLHVLIECLRLAFSVALTHITDPSHMNHTVSDLLSASLIQDLARQFSPHRANPSLTQGTPSSDTVYLCTADRDGNSCSFINSIYHSFGSGIVAEGTGVTLQCRGSNFSLDPTHANCFAPGKRPYHTIIPGMVTDEATGEIVMSFGVMGGFMQPQGQFQVLLSTLAHALSPQAALDAPRICIDAEAGVGSPPSVWCEPGIPQSAVQELCALGHRAAIRDAIGLYGRGQIIKRATDGSGWIGASDKRADGCVTFEQ